MDRIIDKDRMDRIEELEARLRTSQKREAQLKKSLFAWKSNAMWAGFGFITLVGVHALCIDALKGACKEAEHCAKLVAKAEMKNCMTAVLDIMQKYAEEQEKKR